MIRLKFIDVKTRKVTNDPPVLPAGASFFFGPKRALMYTKTARKKEKTMAVVAS